MVRGLPAADVERAIAHASVGRSVTLMILTHVLRLLQGRKLPGSILGSSVLSIPKLDALIFNQLSERQGQAESEAVHYHERK